MAFDVLHSSFHALKDKEPDQARDTDGIVARLLNRLHEIDPILFPHPATSSWMMAARKAG
jgi:hypothetical protein